MLVVPGIKAAETLDFAGFYRAFQDIVDRGRVGKLTDDFSGDHLHPHHRRRRPSSACRA